MHPVTCEIREPAVYKLGVRSVQVGCSLGTVDALPSEIVPLTSVHARQNSTQLPQDKGLGGLTGFDEPPTGAPIMASRLVLHYVLHYLLTVIKNVRVAQTLVVCFQASVCLDNA